MNGTEHVYLAMFVDDGAAFATHERLIAKLFNDLRKRFEITSTLNVANYLGMEISRLTDGSVFVSQGNYV